MESSHHEPWLNPLHTNTKSHESGLEHGSRKTYNSPKYKFISSLLLLFFLCLSLSSSFPTSFANKDASQTCWSFTRHIYTFVSLSTLILPPSDITETYKCFQCYHHKSISYIALSFFYCFFGGYRIISFHFQCSLSGFLNRSSSKSVV